MATPFATSGDLINAGVCVDDPDVANTLCGYASRIVRDEFPDIDDRIAAEKLDADTARWVCISMVQRALESPDDGATQDQGAVGPWSFGGSFGNGKGLYLTKVERGRLSGASSLGGRGGAFTITPTTQVADAMDALPYWNRQ